MSEEVLISLMRQFLNGQIEPVEFKDRYMNTWRSMLKNGWRGNELLDRGFTASDCFTEHPRTIYDISDDELRSDIAQIIRELSENSN